jgi:CsbD-like.
MDSSKEDKAKGGFHEAKGTIKEKAGEATNNPGLRDRGTAEKAGGKIQGKVGDVKKVFGK